MNPMPPQPTTEIDRRPLAVGMLAGVFATAFEGIAVSTAMPAAATQLGRVEWYAWAFSLYMVGMLAGSVTAGRLSDRRGPLPPLAFGAACFAIGLLVAGLAPAMWMLLLGRLIQGLGGGALNVGLYVVIAKAFDEDQRPAMMTAFSACWILPAFVGPPLSAWVTTSWSWHWVFLGILPLILLAALLAGPPLVRLQRRPREAGDRSPVPAWVGLVLAAAAVALQYAGQRVSIRLDWLVAVAALAGVLLLALALPRLMPRGFLTLGRGLPAVVSSRALVAGAFFGGESFIPLMLVQLRGQSLGIAGAMLTVGSLGWFVGSWLQARRWFRLGRHQMITLGAASVAVGLSGCAAVAWWPSLWVGTAWLIWPFAGFGMGLLISSTGLAQITLSRPAEQGRNASALTSGESLGNSIITGLAGTIFAALHLTALPNATFAAVLGAMVLVALLGVLTSARIGEIRAPEPTAR
ncbi:MFS transporter [Enemella evansiae]|uniref:MFS transporter n=2 Tax=Enemella evansiae TaxID=2016499 RepID=A0A255FYB0_9ACTN|nr:MFS transporter [Enemella evansiae]